MRTQFAEQIVVVVVVDGDYDLVADCVRVA